MGQPTSRDERETLQGETNRLTDAVAQMARKILAGKLGDIKVEERDDDVYAQMDIGPVLLEAAGAMLLEGVAGAATRPRSAYVSDSYVRSANARGRFKPSWHCSAPTRLKRSSSHAAVCKAT